MNYINMLTGHKLRGSGYAEILIEAELVTSGCLNSVLKGKAFAKAVFCLKTACEAFERLLLEIFIEEQKLEVIDLNALFKMLHTCSRDTLNHALKDLNIVPIIKT